VNKRLNEEEILETYRGLLGREPESPEVIEIHLSQYSSLSSFLQSVIESEEFLALHVRRFSTYARGANLAGYIETKVDKSTMTLLFNRTVKQWRRLGDEEPFWSVLSADQFEQKTFKQHSDEFWSSGKWILGLLERVKQDFGFEFTDATAVELGCGVGRMTRYRANEVHRVIGIDISPGNLALAESVLSEQFGSASTDKVGLVLLREISQLNAIPKAHVFISFITLQHNCPPVQAVILKSMLSRLEKGGLAIFQLVVAATGYNFNSKDFLDSEEQNMDMHCIPLADVVTIMSQCEVEVLRIEPDDWASTFGLSMTFFGRKF
jgi:SAM-dependent methyltransferase